MEILISIIICCILSFLYIIVYNILMKIKESVLIKKYYNYLWALLVLIIALSYPNSLLRNTTFDFFNNREIVQDNLKIALFACILGCFSGYKTVNKKYDLDFCIIFPIFEEILFRGIILVILVKEGLLIDKYAILVSALLFSIMHFQYFGFSKKTIRYAVFAFIGGYFFSKIVLSAKSILPAIFLHMVFNTSAIIYSRYSNKRYLKNNNIIKNKP